MRSLHNWRDKSRCCLFSNSVTFESFTHLGTRLSLDSIKRRVQIKSGFSKTGDIVEDSKPPLFRANVILAIPSIVMRPSLEDIQNGLNKSVQVILKMTEKIPQWQHLIQQQKQQQKVCTFSKISEMVHITFYLSMYFIFSKDNHL